jgi:hypothetical protein
MPAFAGMTGRGDDLGERLLISFVGHASSWFCRVNWAMALPKPTVIKSFLLLFFKKEVLA